ncbi:MAG TPA: hypothetical protein ENK19_08315 [Acidobacteria bacterium]|nr:hypothetical protein [Acidobacteriota bacterium]
MLRRFAFVLVLVALATPSWAQFVAPGGTIPVVANLPGKNNTFWRSDVSILNVSGENTTVQMVLYPEIRNGQPTFETQTSDPIPVPAGQQVVLTNVVQSKFGLLDKKGALMIFSTDGKPVVLASRTYTTSDIGSYGQDVSSVVLTERAWIAGVENDSLYRTNVGIFWPWDSSAQFTLTVYDSQGEEAASGSFTFSRSGLIQRGLDTLGVPDNLLSGWIEITCSDATALWYAYGTTVDQSTGDSVFRPAQGHQPK